MLLSIEPRPYAVFGGLCGCTLRGDRVLAMRQGEEVTSKLALGRARTRELR